MRTWIPKWCRSECVLLLMASIFLFWDLGRDELGSADEAIHAQVSREMVRDGHWWYPTYRGEPYLEKPPFKLWLTAGTFLLFGESEWTARAWSALFSLGTIMVIFRLGRAMFNPLAGVWSAMVLMTTQEFLFDHCSRTGELDSALLFFSATTVYAFWKLRVTLKPVYLYAASLSLALGFLTKGHLALIPLLWVPIAWVKGQSLLFESKGISLKCFVTAFLIFCFIALPWFFLQQFHYGPRYGDYILRHQLLGYLTGSVESMDISMRYLAERWLQNDYPWPPFVFIGFWILWRNSQEIIYAQAARVWLVLWIAVFAAILFLSRTKLPWYHLPLLLPLSLLAGVALERFWRSGLSKWHVGFWLFLHIGLLFFTSGLWRCLKDFAVAWMFYQQEVERNYAWYFMNDPQQLSFRIMMIVLSGTILTTFIFWIYSRLSGTKVKNSSMSRVILVLSGMVAAAFILLEIKHVQVQEMAREKAFALKVQKPHALDLYIFDQFQETAPHFIVSPAFYYYLNAFPDWKIHHLPTTASWVEFQKTAQKPYAAVVPKDWIRTPTSYLKLGAVRDSELILVPSDL